MLWHRDLLKMVFVVVFLVIATNVAISEPPSRKYLVDNSQGCGLALILAVDVSPSVDGREYRLQMEGLANAFRHPMIVDSARGIGGVAVTVTLWSNHANQNQVVPWMLVNDETSAEVFARATESFPWPGTPWGHGTAIGAAVLHASNLLMNAPYVCKRRVIDVSGDGRSNIGPEPAQVRDLVSVLGITINGIVVLSDEPAVQEYYQKNVVGGPGAFVIGAKDYEVFDQAIKKKLLREIQPKLASRLYERLTLR